MIWLGIGLLIVLFLILAKGVIVPNAPKVDLETIDFLGKRITIRKKHRRDFISIDAHVKVFTPYILDKITRIDSYNPRYIRAGLQPIWSFHAYGQAIDINPVDFPFRIDGSSYPLPDWYQTLALIFRLYGFRWGGEWTTRFDPMHFEIGERSED